MEAKAERQQRGDLSWRLWALVPILLLAVAVGGYVASGSSLAGLIGSNPPQPDEFDIRRVEFKPGEIRVRVTNPQQDDLTIASVTVDDAIVPYSARRPADARPAALEHDRHPLRLDSRGSDLGRGRRAPPGSRRSRRSPPRSRRPGVSGGGFLGYAIIGFLVGVLPVALGLLWLPSLRRVDQRWLTAFMALTAGLLSFLGVEALFEAFELQGALPGAFGGPGLVLLGVATSFLTMTFISGRFSAKARTESLGGVALATLVAIGIGLHNFGEGLAIGTSFAFGQLTLGSFLIVGFMIHNVTEGLGIAAPAADERRDPVVPASRRVGPDRGRPGDPRRVDRGLRRERRAGGALLRRRRGRRVRGRRRGRPLRRAAGSAELRSGYAVGGFLAGIAIMYVTGLLAA